MGQSVVLSMHVNRNTQC